jgi:hypothetical protein
MLGYTLRHDPKFAEMDVVTPQSRIAHVSFITAFLRCFEEISCNVLGIFVVLFPVVLDLERRHVVQPTLTTGLNLYPGSIMGTCEVSLLAHVSCLCCNWVFSLDPI